MNFLGLGPKLEPVHIHWVLYLNDPKRYQKVSWPRYLPFAEIALYNREKTLERAKNAATMYEEVKNEAYNDLKGLIRIIEDADANR